MHKAVFLFLSFYDLFSSTHIRTQNLGYRNRAIGILIEFQYWYQNTRRSGHGVIERVAEKIFLRLGFFIAKIHSTGLEIVESAG